MRARSLPSQILLMVTNIVTGFVLVLLFLRIVLKLFGASIGAPFVEWVYETSAPLLAPFVGIFPSPVFSGSYVIEFSALFALIVYSLIAYLIYELVAVLAYNADRRLGYRDHDHVDDVEDHRGGRRNNKR